MTYPVGHVALEPTPGRVGISRRRFIGILALSAVPPAMIMAVAAPLTAATDRTAPSARRLVRIVAAPDSARAIGRAWLDEQPRVAHSAQLVQALEHDLCASGDAILRARDTDLISGLAARIEHDFAEERTAMVDGWVLSLTEVHLYALTESLARG